MRFARLVLASPFLAVAAVLFVGAGLIVIVGSFIMGREYARELVRALQALLNKQLQ